MTLTFLGFFGRLISCGERLRSSNENGRRANSHMTADQLERHVDGFRLGVFGYGAFAEFTSPTGLFVSAEREGSVECVVTVDPHRAPLDLGGDLVGRRHVAGP